MAFFIRLTDERAEIAKRALGTDTLPILSAIPELMILDGHGLAQCFMVDLDKLSIMDRCGFADEIAKVRGSTRAAVIRDMRLKGLPIRIQGCEMFHTPEAQNDRSKIRG